MHYGPVRGGKVSAVPRDHFRPVRRFHDPRIAMMATVAAGLGATMLQKAGAKSVIGGGSGGSGGASVIVGASGDTTGATDVKNINGALANPKYTVVQGMAGETYYINAPLIIPSTTELNMTGAFVILVAGSNSNMVKNAGSIPAATATDGAINAGSNSLTSAVAASVGNAITIAGAGNGGNAPLTANVTSDTLGTILLQKLGTGAACPALLICLATPLSTSGAITSIAVSALTQALSAGTITLTWGTQTQTFTTTGASVGATTIAVTSATPNFAYPMDTVVSLGTATCGITGATVNVYKRDTNVRLIGGTWERGTVGGTGPNLHSLFFRHVDGLTVDVENYTSTSNNKYGISYSDISIFWMRVQNANCSSSSIQGTGPLFDGRIESVAGSTGDDSCALVGSDWPAYITDSGDMQNISIGNVFCNSANANGFKIISGAGLRATNIKVTGGIYGSVAQSATWLGDDVTQPSTTGGAYGDIDLGHVAATYGATSYGALILHKVNAERIKIDLNATPTVAAVAGVYVAPDTVTSVINHLEVSYSVDFTNTGTTTHVLYHNSAHSTITRVTFAHGNAIFNSAGGSLVNMNGAGAVITEVNVVACRGVYPTTGAGSYYVRTPLSTNTISRVNFVGGSLIGGNSCFRNDAATAGTIVTFSGGFEINAPSRVADSRAGTITYVLAGCRFDNVALAAFFTNASTLLFYGDGMTTSGSFTMLQRNASESVTSYGQGLPFDVATLQTTNGSRATNTNAASGYVGPVISNGTSFLPLAGPGAVPATAITVTSNAGTVPVTSTNSNFTNSSAATMAITMAVTGAVDGQISVVRVYDFSAVAETIGWTNTENSGASVPTTSNGSTTSPKTVTFQYNAATSKWRCIQSV
jgi:hypothetical protein